MSTISNIPVIQDWQLRRLIDILSYEYREVSNMFPGFFTKAYYIRPEGIDWVDIRGRQLRVVKTMGKADLQYDQDVYFRHPHRAVQVALKNKVLVVGFWCDNPEQFMTWLKEKIPDVDTIDYTERILSGRIYVEDVVQQQTPRIPDADIPPQD